MAKVQMNAIFKPDPIVRLSRRDLGRRALSDLQVAGIEFIASLGLKREVFDTQEPDYDFVFPSPLDDHAFAEFLSWRKEMEGELSYAEERLEKLREVADDKGLVVQTASDHLRAIERMRGTARKRRRLRACLQTTTATGITAAAVVQLLLNLSPYPKSELQPLAAAGLGTGVLAGASNFGRLIVDRLLKKHTRRTMLDYWEKLSSRDG